MKSPRECAAEGLKVGDRFTIVRCFSDDDIRHFAHISRDYNPVHCDARYAELHRFKAPIAHGLLTASLVTEIGGQIGWLATGMSFEFKLPVYAGEEITCHWLISDINERGHAKAEVRILNTHGITVRRQQRQAFSPELKSVNASNKCLLRAISPTELT